MGKLSVVGLGIAGGAVWGAGVFLVGVINLIVPTYGLTFLWLASSIYPGYKADPTLISVLIGTLYAIVDGFIGGALLAWFYNLGSSVIKK
ncbi:MAG: hypothetical protein HY588_03740 [Candidatus Omnitrophica bacterium]|nr:hypothetical protein [Candidatus Omnitrophota bacterium]